MGWVVNTFRTAAHSLTTLNATWAAARTASTTALPPSFRDGVALRVAHLSRCDYCASTHLTLALQAGMDENTARDFARGKARTEREQALLDLASQVVENRGHHVALVEAARAAGATDAQIVEVVQLVTHTLFTNYFGHVCGTAVYIPTGDLAAT